MKNKSLYISSLSMLLLMAACADEQIAEFKVEKPANIEQYEYLNAYDALKTYVDRTANPNFKLGIALGANDFVAGGQVHSLAISNFDEMTAGNEMKYASCVSDDGTMNFYNVTNFVNEAKAAGMTIYGHTLGWHSQQNIKYLNSLIADKEVVGDGSVTNKYAYQSDFEDGNPIGGWGNNSTLEVVNEGPDGSKCLKMTNPSVVNPWEAQAAIDLPFEGGQVYYLSFKVKGSVEGSMGASFQHSADYGGRGDFPSMNITTDWTEVLVSTTAQDGADRFLFNYGAYAGSIYIDDLAIYYESNAGEVAIPVSVIEDDYSSGTPIGGWGGHTSSVVDGVCVVENPSESQSWEKQLCYEVTTPFTNGTVYFLRLKIKGTKESSIGVGFQNPNGYIGCGDFPALQVTTDWKEVTISTACTGEGATRLLFNIGAYVGTLYFDDVCLYYEKSANAIPLTPEEKKDTLTWALDNWIKGMMEATGGYVTAWDLANETVSGADDDHDGIYDLQSAENGDPTANFYWPDYLGDIDYVRILESKTRKYFAEYGGNPSDLKLFINDFNLESWWDGNMKAKSLVEWIKRWEADGVTKIDGIGTQMHVSYILNEADQKAQEDAIVNMFRILAESGKLVKISELDMGIVDKAFGTGIKTENVTLEQQQKMAEFYTFIIRKYFEIIPVNQQYGITQWCATDSPADSGWRGGEPVGLWDLNYNRKPAYEGFVNGLRGTDVE
ncbi:Endo-1%2C4-beta-xylanase A precursor [uncultured Bacteroides sp.]|uniref:endo-1,4-beta-xylanase n=1 Tax=Bacteroides cellulolyticus TaxID=2981780 RepID=UPI0008203314|nr:endo-1,4-beta-xylanase [Bacteroides cellulolyticus]MCU6770770.1 endo-1,4-beta-xylanase [Bacteroides cellulolyticus]SCH36869.1 Endo-1%2C4-beta-xylanase A precursor [uncultured Bacteroides sp.]